MPTWGGSFISRMGTIGSSRQLPVVVTVLLIILLAQSLAQLTWNLMPQPEVKENGSAMSMGGSAVNNNQKYKTQIAQISGWHLFGEAQKMLPSAPVKVTEAPATRLNLKLLGVLASTDSKTARAIISDGKGIEDTYAIGKQLPGNAILREIYADRVILEYKGRLEMLRLPKESVVDLQFSSSAGQESSFRSTNGIASSTQLYRPGPQAQSAAIKNPQTTALLRQYREALVNDPQSLMNLVSAAPVAEPGTGKLKGYRIMPGEDKTLLSKFGLQNGDVVTAVNGVPLDNPIKALEIMRDLSTASSVSLDIERRGATQSLSFQVE